MWKVFEPLLSPIVTPASLELPPFRELSELCSGHGYTMDITCNNDGDDLVTELKVQLEDVLLVRQGRSRSKKTSKACAATLLLKDLEVCSTPYILYTHFFNCQKHMNMKILMHISLCMPLLHSFFVLEIRQENGLLHARRPAKQRRLNPGDYGDLKLSSVVKPNTSLTSRRRPCKPQTQKMTHFSRSDSNFARKFQII